MSEAVTETAERTEPTAEELQRRAEQLRRDREQTRSVAEGSGLTTTSSITSGDHFSPDDRTGLCIECGHPFSYRTYRGSKQQRTVCERCVDESKKTRAAEELQRLAAEQERVRAARDGRILELIENAGANAIEHRSATLASFDVAESGYRPVQLAQRFIAEASAAGKYDEVKGLYFWGGTGTGKTHLAVATMRELLRDITWNPNSVVYDHAAELVARIQNTYGGKGDSMELLERRFDARLWILDDLGTERASDDVARHLTLIFTRRALRPTIVTSNIPLEQMEKDRPELQRVVSRLGPAYFRATEVKGRDRRFD